MADGVELEAPILDDLDADSSRFRRLVAVCVVLITFFGAIVAYVQAVESNQEDVAAREAQRDAIRGLGDQVDASAELTTDLLIATAVDAQRQRQALNAARVQALSENEDDVHLAARERFAAVAEALAVNTPIDAADPGTFDTVRAGLFEGPDAARLRQGVQADLANDHGDKADAFIAVLTVLAVALFLLGLSLTVQGRSRYVLAGPGVVIAFACVAWVGLISRQGITRVSESAIQSAAEGQRFQDARDFEAAIDSYDSAIADSPDFAAAYARRAAARFLQGSPQRGQTVFTSITSDDALEDAIDDLERALDLGADADVNTVADAGFFTFLDRDFERSVALSEQALELNERIAPVWFNLGVAHVAQGNDDEAERAYRRGLRVLDDIPDPGTRSAVLAGARTDLSILRELLDGDDLDDVEDLIEATEVELAHAELESASCAGEACPEGADADDAEVGESQFSRIGAFVLATVGVEGLEPGDAVASVWYFRTDDSLPFEQAAISFDAQLVADDGTVTTSTLPSFDPPCPVGGEYLVRFYAGETFVGEAAGTIDPSLFGASFTAFVDSIEGVEACIPEDVEVTRADLSQLDAFTLFAGASLPADLSVNVTPGALSPGLDPTFLVDSAIGAVTDEAPRSVQLNGRDVDGNFVFIDGRMAIDVAQGLAVAVAAGPDSSVRTILLNGDVNEDLLLEAIGLVNFIGVGLPAP